MVSPALRLDGLLPPSMLAFWLVAQVAANADFVLQDADSVNASVPAVVNASVITAAGGTAKFGIHADGRLAYISNAPSHFRTPGPDGGTPCGKRTRTSVTAKANKCRYATNASPGSTINCRARILRLKSSL